MSFVSAGEFALNTVDATTEAANMTAKLTNFFHFLVLPRVALVAEDYLGPLIVCN